MLRLVLITAVLMTTSCSDTSSSCNKKDTLKLISAGYTKAEISNICGQEKQQIRSQLTDEKSFTYEGLEQFEAETNFGITDKNSSAVKGKVVDSTNSPIKDVSIDAVTNTNIEEDKRYERISTMTNSNGEFVLDGLSPRYVYAIIASHNDYWAQDDSSTQINPAPVGKTLLLQNNLKLAKKRIIKSFVKDRFTQSPIENAYIQIYQKSWGTEKTTLVFDTKTDSSGNFSISIPPGKYDLEVYSNETIPYKTSIITEVNTEILNEAIIPIIPPGRGKVFMHMDGNPQRFVEIHGIPIRKFREFGYENGNMSYTNAYISSSDIPSNIPTFDEGSVIDLVLTTEDEDHIYSHRMWVNGELREKVVKRIEYKDYFQTEILSTEYINEKNIMYFQDMIYLYFTSSWIVSEEEKDANGRMIKIFNISKSERRDDSSINKENSKGIYAIQEREKVYLFKLEFLNNGKSGSGDE